MRSLTALVALSVMLCVAVLPLWAAEAAPKPSPKPSPKEMVLRLEEVIHTEGATWPEKYKAYKAAKASLKAAPKDLFAADEYARIQPDVADALRRDNLPTSGWIMGFVAASLMWGGFAFCLGVARKSGKAKPTSGS